MRPCNLLLCMCNLCTGMGPVLLYPSPSQPFAVYRHQVLSRKNPFQSKHIHISSLFNITQKTKNILPPSHPRWQSPATVVVRRFLRLAHPMPVPRPRSRLVQHGLAIFTENRGCRRCRRHVPRTLAADFVDSLAPCLADFFR